MEKDGKSFTVPENKDLKKVVILGVPNTGKSTLFTSITRQYSAAANYPHTTTEDRRAQIVLNGCRYEIIDTPGMDSLSAFSEDDFVARNIILREGPHAIIQCVEAASIKRSLLLTVQLVELDIPLVICLNLMDEAQAKGMWVDTEKLESTLGVPVVETIASSGTGVDELIRKIPHARVSDHRARYSKAIRNRARELEGYFPHPPPPPGVLLLLLSQESDILGWVTEEYGTDVSRKIGRKTAQLLPKELGNISTRLLDTRNEWANDIAQQTIHRSKISAGRASEKIGELVRHPVFGWVILAGILYGTYVLVARIGAVHVAGWLNGRIFVPLADAIGSVIPWQFLREFLVGDYGILTIGLFSAIGTVLPILTIFFVILALLEDIGYLPNLCVFTNHFLKKIGLSGKSVLPLTLGFGCKTMATMATNTLESRKERYIAIFLIAFCIPCSAQLGLSLAILAFFPFSATMIVLSVLLATEIAAGAVLSKLLKPDVASDFLVEIPPIRLPNLRNLGTKVYHRVKHFLREALPLFLIGAVVLFTIDRIGILLVLKKIMSPVIESFLSLPIETLEGFILCLVRHEQGAALLLDMTREGQLSYVNAVVCIIVVTGFVPCFNNIAAMIKKLGIKRALTMVPIITGLAILIGGAVNWLLRLVLGV